MEAKRCKVTNSDWEEVPLDNKSDWEEVPLNEESKPWYDISAKGLGKSALESLPLAGSIAGGAVGSLIGPWGTVGGAGLGAAAGKSLEEVGKSLFTDEKAPTREEFYKGLGQEATSGAMSEVGGQIAEKGILKTGEALGKLKGLLSDWQTQFKTMPKENTPEIIAASQALGFEPSKGMLSKSKQIQTLEEGLTKGGGIFSTPYIKQQQAMQEGISKGLGQVEKKATGATNIALGEEAAKNLLDEVARLEAPMKEAYQSIEKPLQKIPMNEPLINKAMGVARRNDLFRSTNGEAFLNEIQDEIKNLSSVKSLNEYISDFYKRSGPMATGREKAYIDSMYGVLKDLRNNTIYNSAGRQSVKNNLIDTLANAEKMYADNINQINSISNVLGSSADFKSPGAFKQAVNAQDFEKIGKQIGSTGAETLTELQNKFPGVFEKAKEAQINRVIDKSLTKGELDLGKFVRNIKSISPEAQKLIFDPETLSTIKNLETVYQSIPGPINPSNTSGMQRAWQSFSSPGKAVQDYIASKALQGATPEGSPFAKEAIKKVESFQNKMMPGGFIFEVPTKTIKAIPFMNNEPTQKPQEESPTYKPSTSTIMDKVKGSQYEQLLNNALKNGGEQSFAAANYVLKNRDQNYRKLFDESEG